MRYEITFETPRDSFNLDGEIIRTCLSLDSIDLRIFNVYLIKFLTANDTSVRKGDKSFQGILNRINIYKRTDLYKQTHERFVLAYEFDNKIASPENFKKDRIDLAKLGMTPADLDNFEKFIGKNASRKITYSMALKEFINSKYSDQNLEPPSSTR